MLLIPRIISRRFAGLDLGLNVVVNLKRKSHVVLLRISNFHPPSRSRLFSTSTREMDSLSEMKAMENLFNLFKHGTSTVVPDRLIKKHVSLTGTVISIKNEISLDLLEYEKVFVVGFGKAVLPMAEEILSILQDKVNRCVISVPHATRASQNSKIEIYRGARNNIPDSNAQHAATKIVELAKSCSTKDLLLVLVTGGGSALLPLPRQPITLEEKLELIKDLSRAGANIVELNTVRKQISLVKGGRLVGLCQAKRICSLVLSDVLGDRLDIIASGPTVHSEMGGASALDIVKQYISVASIPQSILQVLQEVSPEVPEHLFKRVNNIIVGSNTIALREIASLASNESDCIPIILSSTLDGDARVVGEQLAQLSDFVSGLLSGKHSEEPLIQVAQKLEIEEAVIAKLLSEISRARTSGIGLVLLFGGETTVKVSGKGCGGRNQELALAAAMTLHRLKHTGKITILSAGTDGIDGPCDAAGAVVSCNTIPNAIEAGLKAEDYLANNDSYTFFTKLANGKYHLHTGHTGTNVMDIVLINIAF